MTASDGLRSVYCSIVTSPSAPFSLSVAPRKPQSRLPGSLGNKPPPQIVCKWHWPGQHEARVASRCCHTSAGQTRPPGFWKGWCSEAFLTCCRMCLSLNVISLLWSSTSSSRYAWKRTVCPQWQAFRKQFKNKRINKVRTYQRWLDVAHSTLYPKLCGCTAQGLCRPTLLWPTSTFSRQLFLQKRAICELICSQVNRINPLPTMPLKREKEFNEKKCELKHIITVHILFSN